MSYTTRRIRLEDLLMHISPIDCIWILVGVIWLCSAAAQKRTTRREPSTSRLIHVTIMAAAFLLLFPNLVLAGRMPAGPLDNRFLPDLSLFRVTGTAFAIAGCGFAIWARLLLGSNWSASVTLKHDHELMRRGPYRIVRHPIYAGFLLGLVGTALALGEWRGIFGVALAFGGWYRKSRTEEALMTEQFGSAYAAYREQVRGLIPFVL